MKVKFWGVRGSIPTPGSETQAWGGNTSCVEVRKPGHDPLVFDCGTGARGLGLDLIGREPRRLDLVFTHLHMDHLFGLPFFMPIYTPGYHVRITVPAHSNEEATEKVAKYLNGLYHPTRLDSVPATLEFRAIRPGMVFDVSGFEAQGVALNHPGGSVGYRVTDGERTIAYMTDTGPFAKPGEGVHAAKAPTPAEERIMNFLQGCDLVVYDTMYTLDEYLERPTWGHCYPEYAHSLCRAAGVGRLALFHHLPDASDAVLDRRAASWAQVESPPAFLAREGETVSVEG